MSNLTLRKNYDPFVDLFSPFTYPSLRNSLFGFRNFSGMSDSLSNYSAKETDDAYLIRASLPGHTNETVDVQVEDEKLRIEAHQSQEDSEITLINEHFFEFKLPKNCDSKNIEAKMENGILLVTLKKVNPKKEITSTKIKVK